MTNHKNIIHARNVFCNGYVDGDDTDFAVMDGRGAVSYTHLTLPTILLV